MSKDTKMKQNQAGNPGKSNVVSLQPLTDIYESEQGAILYIDLPGVSKETLAIDVEQNVLTIKGEIKLEMPDNLKPTYIDVRSEVYERRFTLGDELDSSRISASFNQGELKLVIPRLEQHKPKKIEIKVA